MRRSPKGDGTIEEKLLVEEYKSCRELIAKNIDIMERTEVYAVAASAALFVFSLSATVRTVAVASAWLPLIIAILGFMRFFGLDDTIDKINSYFIELEKKHGSIHWTTFYREKNKKKVLKKTRYSIWFVLMIVGLGFGVYMSTVALLSKPDTGSSVQVHNRSNGAAHARAMADKYAENDNSKHP